MRWPYADAGENCISGIVSQELQSQGGNGSNKAMRHPDGTDFEPTHGRGTDVSETFDQSEPVQWYDITIGGKRFNIASRHGESHIRKLELLLERTVEEMNQRVLEKGPTTVALLTALNLADQLLVMEADQTAAARALNSRLEGLLQRLEGALGGGHATRPASQTQTHIGQGTPAVFD